MTKQSPSLRIGLLDNASHSLQRGYEMLAKGRDKKDALALKEAIIWIHHGIELSLKQLLVQSNEYLVFENVDEAVRKLAHLRRQPGMSQATVSDLFDYGEGVYTVPFNKLAERSAVMLGLSELAQGTSLREKIDELTTYRNKIVHFSVEVQLDEVISLLADLVEPFLALLEREVKDDDFVKRCIPYVRANAESVGAVYKLRHSELESRLVQLIRKFDGQQVPGNLFGIDGVLVLPKFTEVQMQAGSRDVRADIFAKSALEHWMIELKLGPLNSSQLLYYRDRLVDLQKRSEIAMRLWLVFGGTTRVVGGKALLRHQVLRSSEADIAELENILRP